MMGTRRKEIRGGLALDVELKLDRLAVLFSERAGGVRSPEAMEVAREVARTNAAFAAASWKLLEIWEDYGTADVIDAVAAYETAGWQEAVLLAQPAGERRLAVRRDPELQTRELALRLLVTDERLWHERPEATLEVTELAIRVTEAAFRRQGGHLRLLGGDASSRPGLPELETWIRTYGRYVNALRIRGDFEAVRRHVKPLEELTRDPIGKSLTEARWLLGVALIELEEWDLADAALVDAIREYRRIGKLFETRRARISRVRLLRASGAAPQRYLTAARRVIASFTEEDRLRDPNFVTGCRLNLILYMVEAGELRQAEELLRATPRYDKAPLEARRIGGAAIVDFSTGRVEAAEKGFRVAVLRFESLAMPYDEALFLLRLADLCLATGRFYEGEKCLHRALELFSRCRLKRHVVEALARLREALRLKEGLRTALALAIARASGIVRRHGEGPA